MHKGVFVHDWMVPQAWVGMVWLFVAMMFAVSGCYQEDDTDGIDIPDASVPGFHDDYFVACSANAEQGRVHYSASGLIETNEALGLELLTTECVLVAGGLECDGSTATVHPFHHEDDMLQVDLGDHVELYTAGSGVWLGTVRDHSLLFLKSVSNVTMILPNIHSGDNVFGPHQKTWAQQICADASVEAALGSGGSVTPVNPTGLTLSSAAVSLAPGATAHLNATVQPPDATVHAVTWTSDNESAATVDANGLVTAVADGSATITATLSGTPGGPFTTMATVTVATPAVSVTSVTLSGCPTGSVPDSEPDITLTGTVAPPTASDASVTWVSTHPAVATVDASGVVDVLASGDTTLLVSTTDGNIKARCDLSVDAVMPPVVPLSTLTDPTRPWSAETIDQLANDRPDWPVESFVPSSDQGELHRYEYLRMPDSPNSHGHLVYVLLVVYSAEKIGFVNCNNSDYSDCRHLFLHGVSMTGAPGGTGVRLVQSALGLDIQWNGSNFVTSSGGTVTRVCPTGGTGCP